MDSLSALNLFVHAAEGGSFTEAGRQMGLSSSAVGRAVARLEDRLGVRLFQRSTRRVALTQEGEMLLGSCQRIFSEIRSIEQQFSQAAKSPKGKLRVDLPSVWMLLLPSIGRFVSEYPDIGLEMDFDEAGTDVIGGGYDVVILSGEISDSQLMARKLGAYRHVLAASPHYLSRSGMLASPDDLALHACLHLKSPLDGKRQRWPLTLTSDVEVPVTVAATALEPLISMAELGLGIACVPDFAVRQQICDGRLVSVLEDHVDGVEEFRAVWPSSRHVPQKVRVFLDFLSGHLARAKGANVATIRPARGDARAASTGLMAVA